MSQNGAPSPSPTSPSSQPRSSTDGALSPGPDPKPNGLTANGHVSPSDDLDASMPTSPDELRAELVRTREEKEQLATQYQNLVTKLNTMRSTLGTKLKQDAEELDRREQLIAQLTLTNDDLSSTLSTLQSELLSATQDADARASELSALRSRLYLDASAEEGKLRDAQSELERLRLERDEYERDAARARLESEEERRMAAEVQRTAEVEAVGRRRAEEGWQREKEAVTNLQAVIEDFQAAKDGELKKAVRELQTRYDTVAQSLAEYKHRAHTAEMQLESSASDTSKTAELEQKVKEKNLLIGKLRHEAVILNEHLIEALRRLRTSTADTNVDRRLVTNVLLQYIATPRGDSKRFEMLQLLASVLNWSEAEREKAGLQRGFGAGAGEGGGGALRPPTTGAPTGWQRRPSLQPEGLGSTDETESFSNLWVEFLLTESGRESSGPGSAGVSPAGTPTRASFSTTSTASPHRPTRKLSSPAHGHEPLPGSGASGSGSWLPRLPSFTNMASAAASSSSLLSGAPSPSVSPTTAVPSQPRLSLQKDRP